MATRSPARTVRGITAALVKHDMQPAELITEKDEWDQDHIRAVRHGFMVEMNQAYTPAMRGQEPIAYVEWSGPRRSAERAEQNQWIACWLQTEGYIITHTEARAAVRLF